MYYDSSVCTLHVYVHELIGVGVWLIHTFRLLFMCVVWFEHTCGVAMLSELQIAATRCIPHSATHYNMLQHALQHIATHYNAPPWYDVSRAHMCGAAMLSRLQYTATHCNTWDITHYNTLQHVATRCNTPLWCDASACMEWQCWVGCNTLQHAEYYPLKRTATRYNALQHTTVMWCEHIYGMALLSRHQYTATRRISPTATRCNTLQHSATHHRDVMRAHVWSGNAEQAEAHCNTLQHTATHCNAPQHTATRGISHTTTHCNALLHATAMWCERMYEVGYKFVP